MARPRLLVAAFAVAAALAVLLLSPRAAEARGGKNGIPDSVSPVPVVVSSSSSTSSSSRQPLLDRLKDADPVCNVCLWAWSNAQDALSDPDTQAAVMRFAEQTACGVLPAGEASKCKAFVQEYLPQAIATLESFDADEACGAVGFCDQQQQLEGGRKGKASAEEVRRVLREAFAFSSSAKLMPPTTVTLPSPTTSTSATPSWRLGGPACPACRLALNSVKLQLEDPANQQQLLDKAHSVCATLPADSAQLCDSTVDENAAKLFAVVADFDCNTLCVVAGACPPPDPPSPPSPPKPSALPDERGRGPPVGKGGEDLFPTTLSLSSLSPSLGDDPVDLCGICTSVLTQLRDAVEDPEKQREAMAKAAEVCSALRRFRDECLGYVQRYGPIVIDTVGQYVGPDLCVASGVCTTAATAEEGLEPVGGRKAVDVA